MKPSQHKATTSQHPHPSLFSISIFQSAQQFLALYLAIQNQNFSYRHAAAKYLQQLLHRTKSAPIALTYTKQFLLLTSESQIQLTIIRFISQLSDLSAGKSMQSSLSFIIDNSSFLTELRHNLTHRVMVKGLVIERGKQMILEELKDKYWKVMFQKVWKIYCIDEDQVKIFFDHITQVSEQKQSSEQEIKKCKIYEEYQRKLKQQTESRLTKEYLFSECQSNYEFKSLIKPYILKTILPALSDKSFNDEQDQAINFSNQINQQALSGLVNLSDLRSLSNTRSTILVSTMLEIILSMHKYKGANQCSKYRRVLSQVIVLVLVKIEEGQKQQTNKKASKQFHVFTSAVVTKKLRQIYLIHSIEEYGAVIAALPEEVRQSLERYWAQKEVALGKPVIFQA